MFAVDWITRLFSASDLGAYLSYARGQIEQLPAPAENLAARLYEIDTGFWPVLTRELVPDYLPPLPLFTVPNRKPPPSSRHPARIAKNS
jgi:hypothetical protein